MKAAEPVAGWTRLLPTRLFGNSSVLVATMATSAVLRFGSNLILTRLLFPEAFGIVLIVMSVSYALVMLSETGIDAFVIRNEKADRRHYLDALFTVQFVRGIILAGGMFAVAPLAADLLGKPEATDAIRLSSLMLLITGSKSLAPLIARRSQKERKNSVVELGAYVVNVAVLLILAAIFRSYWALVIGIITGSLSQTLASYLFYKDSNHRLVLDKTVIRELWKFARFIFASSVTTLVVVQFDKIFVASQFPLALAGLYAMAWNLANVGDQLNTAFFRRIYFPAVSHSLRSSASEARIYYHPMRFMRPLIVFFAAGGITFGEAFFAIAFDDRYLQAGTFFSILAIKPIFGALNASSENYLVATGRTHAKFVSDCMRLAWLPAMATLGWSLYEIPGLLLAVATVDLLPTIYQYVLLAKLRVVRAIDEVIVPAAIACGLGTGWAASMGAVALGLT